MSTDTAATEIVTTRSSRKPLFIGLAVVATIVAGLVVAGAVYLFSGSWYVEYECSPGEAPASSAHQGNGCFKEGSELPQGFSFDEGGNQRIN